MSVATSGMDDPVGQAGKGRVKDAILIAGPTASGKSALALDLAERIGGVIVNTDSMQGYSVLDVLTARPSASEMARAPHFLYGHVHPSTAYSTGAWLRDVTKLIDDGVEMTDGKFAGFDFGETLPGAGRFIGHGGGGPGAGPVVLSEAVALYAPLPFVVAYEAW